MADRESYITARMACEVARKLLEGHNFDELLADIDRADALGPLLDPTLYREKHRAMEEDAEVFRAALRFLSTWRGRGEVRRG